MMGRIVGEVIAHPVVLYDIVRTSAFILNEQERCNGHIL